MPCPPLLLQPESEQANAAGAVAYNSSEAAARALKDRLVEYDRHAAKRTTVGVGVVARDWNGACP